MEKSSPVPGAVVMTLTARKLPTRGKCLTCGLEFTIRQVAVWEE